jgi:hypothetical protein
MEFSNSRCVHLDQGTRPHRRTSRRRRARAGVTTTSKCASSKSVSKRSKLNELKAAILPNMSVNGYLNSILEISNGTFTATNLLTDIPSGDSIQFILVSASPERHHLHYKGDYANLLEGVTRGKFERIPWRATSREARITDKPVKSGLLIK